MISCEQHDYIEIVCTYQYPIKLTMKSGKLIKCVAVDTSLNENRIECIKVDIDGVDSLIVLDDISVLEVCVNNPHFISVTFS